MKRNDLLTDAELAAISWKVGDSMPSHDGKSWFKVTKISVEGKAVHPDNGIEYNRVVTSLE